MRLARELGFAFVVKTLCPVIQGLYSQVSVMQICNTDPTDPVSWCA